METLQRRMTALEAEHFALVQQLRKVADTTERNANSLDDLEDVLTDVSVNAAENADAMAAAMAQRQASLDNEGAPDPATAAPAAPTPAAGGQPGGGQGGGGQGGGGQGGGGVEAPEMDVLHAWVEDHIAPMVRKTTTTGEGGGVRWCRQWWEHVDATERFIALYLAFQELSVDESATWLSVYLRDHLDPHLSTLTSPYGPFYACSPRKHSDAVEALGTDERPSTQHSGSTP
jgi:hypothetical protein